MADDDGALYNVLAIKRISRRIPITARPFVALPMKPASSVLAFPILFACLWLFGWHPASAAPGDADPLFTHQIGGSDVQAIAIQADGKIVLGGRISSAGGVPSEGLARIFPDGTADTSFNPSASLNLVGLRSIFVDEIRLQKDGKILATGWFLGGEGSASGLMRFHPDGSMDTAFAKTPAGVSCIFEQLPDGKILLGGSLYLEGQPSLGNLIRLNSDGSVDPGFTTLLNGYVDAMQVLDDGRIMVGGSFTAAGGATEKYLVRLHADGSLDGSYVPNVTASVTHLIAQPDGKLILSHGLPTGAKVLRRLMPDGSLDAAFNVTLSHRVSANLACLQLQTDGKILMGGNFETVNGTAREGFARVLPNGSLDPTFVNSGTNDFGEGSIAIQADGKILAGGHFSSLGNGNTYILARLQNDSVASSFVQDATMLKWLRSGASSEVGQVSFESHDPATNAWLPLANRSRIAGGWSVPASSLPANGTVRARGIGKMGSAGTSEVREHVSFGNAVPALLVDGSEGTPFANGSTVNSGNVLDGYSTVKSFKIRNTGTGALQGLSLVISGPDAAQFKVADYSPGEVGPGSDLPFTIRFSPVGVGAKSGLLTVSSNNPGGAFTLQLTGTATTVFSPYFASPQDVPLIIPASQTFLASGKTFGSLELGFAPEPGTVLTAVNQLHQNNLISGEFSDQPDGSRITATFGGQSYVFIVGYRGGTGNDLTLSLSGAGMPRRDLRPVLNGVAKSIAVSPLRRIMTLTQNNSLSLLREDGSPITTFIPDLKDGANTGYPTRVVACADGKFLVAGRFDNVNGFNRVGLVRFDAGGNVDPSFNANLTGEWIQALSLQEDGKILMAGGFTNATVMRLNEDGSPDLTFSATINGIANILARLSNGKILVIGSFDTVNGVSRRDVARLNPDGSLDVTFSFVSSTGYYTFDSFAEQTDGKLVIADRANVTAGQLRRINLDGSYDPTFMPDFGSPADFGGISIQTDGKIVVGGYFAEVNGRPRSGLVRLLTDGSTDPKFGGFCAQVDALVPLSDGEIIINGGIVAGTNHPGLARLMNDPAVMFPEIPDAATVRLVTGGAAPELRYVIFDVLASGGTDWVRLGQGTRAAGGWSLTGLNLPSVGIVRWRSTPSAHSGSSSAMEGYINFGTAIPNIVVTGPAGNLLTSGAGSVDIGPVLTGERRTVKLRVTNSGNGAWQDFVPEISGTNAASFEVIAVPERPVLPGETGVFELSFSPSTPGNHSALLTLSSNDSANSPFQISLAGTGDDVLSPTFYDAGDVVVTAGSFTTTGKQFGTLHLAFAPPAGTVLTAVMNTGSSAISGRFGDLADGAVVNAEFGGVAYQFIAGYAGGDGNDLVLSLIGPGILDLTHQATTSSGSVVSTPMESGGTLVGGTFSSINGEGRSRLAHLKADGTLASDFNPILGSTVSSSFVAAIHRLPDGKTIIAGEFTTLDGEPVVRVARLMPDGSADPFFLVIPEGFVRTAAIQADGKIVIGGDFLKVNGVARNRIARLNADGSLDMGFNPNASSSVRYSAVQPDGKILIAGLFTSVGGTNRPYFARLEASGALDQSFTPALAGSQGTVAVSAIQVQPDGKIVIGGNFNRLNGVTCNLIGRLTPAGATDTTFNASVSGPFSSSVMAITSQVDGKLLIGGSFTGVNCVVRNRFARLNPDGSLDESINPDFKGTSVSHIALRPDGKIQVSGTFTSVNGVARQGFVRLLNHEATSSFEKSGFAVVRWMRGGTFPLETGVAFEAYEPGGTAWQPLGEAARIPGGWELGGLSLPPSAVIRTRSRISINNASYQQNLLLPAFGNTAPILAVRDSAGNLLQSTVSQSDFGSVPTSMAVEMKLQIANEGLATLENIAVTLAGTSAGDFSLIDLPAASLPPSEVSTIQIRFTPTAAGLRQAELRISSSDAGASPFVIKLEGTGGSVFSPVFGSVGDKPISGPTLDFTGLTFGSLILKFSPPVGKAWVAADNTGTSPVGVMLAGLPDQSRVTAEFSGEIYQFLATYRGGDGNDLAFIRLGPGVADPAFDPRPGNFAGTFGLHPDGRVIVAGNFTTLGGLPRARIMRLLPDGSVDPSFNISLSNRAEGMAVLRNGKTIVTSSVITPNGTVGAGLARLNVDGTVDPTFAPQITGSVIRVTELRNGKLLIGGGFTKVGAVTKTGIALLNADGTLDTGFTTSLADSRLVAVYAFVEQPDGSILIGGSFTSVNGIARAQLAKLSATGALEPAFNAGPGRAGLRVVLCRSYQHSASAGRPYSGWRLLHQRRRGASEPPRPVEPGRLAGSRFCGERQRCDHHDAASGRWENHHQRSFHPGERSAAQGNRALECGWNPGSII